MALAYLHTAINAHVIFGGRRGHPRYVVCEEHCMPFPARGVLTASLVSLGVFAAAAYPASALAAPPVVKLPATAGQPARGIIVMLRTQHKDLSVTRSTNSPRAQADRKDQ